MIEILISTVSTFLAEWPDYFIAHNNLLMSILRSASKCTCNQVSTRVFYYDNEL